MYITLLLLVWILYAFTSFSNDICENLIITQVWILYAFTSFSNAWVGGIIKVNVWILYVFTSFSNDTCHCCLYDLFEYYTFLHHSQTLSNVPWLQFSFEYYTFLHHSQTVLRQRLKLSLFEYYTFLHHSQTQALICSRHFCLNTIRFYIILKLASPSR